MTTCVVGGVQSKLLKDTPLFTLQWADLLNTGLSSTVAAMDRIASSVWAYDLTSPNNDMVIQSNGFDDSSHQTWVTLSGGTDSGVYYINNMIITEGAIYNGKQTPPQTYVRQIRIRVSDC